MFKYLFEIFQVISSFLLIHEYYMLYSYILYSNNFFIKNIYNICTEVPCSFKNIEK